MLRHVLVVGPGVLCMPAKRRLGNAIHSTLAAVWECSSSRKDSKPAEIKLQLPVSVFQARPVHSSHWSRQQWCGRFALA